MPQRAGAPSKRTMVHLDLFRLFEGSVGPLWECLDGLEWPRGPLGGAPSKRTMVHLDLIGLFEGSVGLLWGRLGHVVMLLCSSLLDSVLW